MKPSQKRWFMPVIPTLEKLKHEGPEFGAILG